MNKRTTWRQRTARVFLLFLFTVCLIFVLIHLHHTTPTPTKVVQVQLPEQKESLPAPAAFTPPKHTIKIKQTHIEKHKPLIKKAITQTKTKNSHWFANPSLIWMKISVRHGDSLYLIFKRHHLSYGTLKKVLTLPDAKKYFTRLRPGESLYLYNQPKLKHLAIKYPIDGERTLYIYTDQTKYKELLANKPLSKHILFKSVKIKSNFKHAVKAAGLTHQQIDQLETIFEGEINFAHDVHSGDQFSLLYNEYYWHGKKVKPGEILAAEFTHHGKTYKAIRFTYPRNHTGYYMPNGSGVEPLFLKRPLHYKRISGKFSLRRFDPFLKIVHPHLGVDFAAKYGTPIKSIGAGKVIFHGWKGGYGKAVIVRYNRKYKALYGHMSRYAKGIRNGMIVKKGQVIGYVGSTGWATGPHLHFEIYVYGIPHNPLKMKFVGGKSVPKAYLSSFHKEADAMLNDLKRYQGRGFSVVDNKK